MRNYLGMKNPGRAYREWWRSADEFDRRAATALGGLIGVLLATIVEAVSRGSPRAFEYAYWGIFAACLIAFAVARLRRRSTRRGRE
jgi:hypothetical protein